MRLTDAGSPGASPDLFNFKIRHIRTADSEGMLDLYLGLNSWCIPGSNWVFSLAESGFNSIVFVHNRSVKLAGKDFVGV